MLYYILYTYRKDRNLNPNFSLSMKMLKPPNFWAKNGRRPQPTKRVSM